MLLRRNESLNLNHIFCSAVLAHNEMRLGAVNVALLIMYVNNERSYNLTLQSRKMDESFFQRFHSIKIN